MTTIPIKVQSFELGYGSIHSEDLGISPAQIQADPNHIGYVIEGNYQLSFSVQNVDPSYPGYFDVEISFGTQELGSCDGWASRYVSQISIICPCSGYIILDKLLPSGGPVQGKSNLAIRFFVPEWAIKFSNVSLTFTPTS